MNVSLRQLKAFLHLARLRSFTRASEQLHISQAGLSSMIQDLEIQLDCRLFDRTTRAVTLTSAGKQLLPAAEQSVNALDGVSIAIGRMEANARQTLTVAATPMIASSLMPEVCTRFRRKHPNVTVRLFDVDRYQIQDMVNSGEIDFGFGVFFKPAAGIERLQIFSCDLVCLRANEAVKPAARSKASVERMSWTDLENIPLIGLATDNPLQQLVDSHLAKVSRANEVRPTYRNFQTVLTMVEAGFGAAVLPSFVIAAVRRLKVHVALLSDPVVPVNFYKISLKGRARPEAEDAFVKCLLEIMTEKCTLKSRQRQTPKTRAAN
jgi:DNA-binding transcriptional LysR family regulator